jgi:hypothetical protein
MLNTYNSYIFDNYKYNIDERIKTPESTDTTFEESIKKHKAEPIDNKSYVIYDFPCSSKPYDPVYSI